MEIRILVVDHDGDLLTLVQHCLHDRHPNIKIVSAISLLDAVRSFEFTKVDAVISDYELGEGDNGVDLLEWVKEEYSNIPFIIFAKSPDRDTIIKALNLQADYFLEKNIEQFEQVFFDLIQDIIDSVKSNRAEKAIQEAEQRFREVLESSRDAFYKFDVIAGKFVYLSPSVESVLGYTAEELISRGFEGRRKLNHPDELEMLREHREKLIKGIIKDADISEYRFKDPEGNYRWISDNHAVIRNSEDNSLFVIGSMRDVTERKKREHLLILQRDISYELAKTQDMTNTLKLFLEMTLKVIDFDFAICHLRRENHDGFYPVVSINIEEDMVKNYEINTDGIQDSKENYESKEVPIESACSIPTVFREYAQIRVIQLRCEEETLGFVTLGSKEIIAIPNYVENWLENIMTFMSSAIRRIQRYEAIEKHNLSLKSIISEFSRYLESLIMEKDDLIKSTPATYDKCETEKMLLDMLVNLQDVFHTMSDDAEE